MDSSVVNYGESCHHSMCTLHPTPAQWTHDDTGGEMHVEVACCIHTYMHSLTLSLQTGEQWLSIWQPFLFEMS